MKKASTRYIKTGPKMGIECPFCTERVIEFMDEHMREKHPDFWRVVCEYQAVKAHGWPKL